MTGRALALVVASCLGGCFDVPPPPRSIADASTDAPAPGEDATAGADVGDVGPCDCATGGACYAAGDAHPTEPCRRCAPDGGFVACPFACEATVCVEPVALALGERHSCALTDDGGAYCWGARDRAQAGTPRKAAGPAPPRRLPYIEGAVSLAAGADHACALSAAGQLWCWGASDRGQGHSLGVLGGPVATAQTGPGALAAGRETTCHVGSDGALACWGVPLDGVPFDDDNRTFSVSTAVPIAGLAPEAAHAAAVGDRQGCVIAGQARGLRCWGANDAGQLATGDLTPRPNTATAVHTELPAPVHAVALGARHGCALVGDPPTARCWGDNARGAVGIAMDHTVAPVPREVSGLARPIVGLAAGRAHSCALDVDGQVLCWGDNASYQLGRVDVPATSVPAPVEHLPPAAVIAAGADHTCAIGVDGAVRCWGAAGDGRLGLVPPLPVPAVSLPLQVRAAPAPSCDLGDRTLAPGEAHPTLECRRCGPTGTLVGCAFACDAAGACVPAVDVTAGSSHACALLADGGVRCWGDPYYGAIGDGMPGSAYRGPTAPLGLPPAKQVVARANHTCAVAIADGGVWCWGRNLLGELGLPASAAGTLAVPTRAPIDGVELLATGAEEACARFEGGAVACWGRPLAEVVAHDDPAIGFELPRVVADLDAPVAGLALAGRAACALLDDGAVRCWGRDDVEALGNGTVATHSATPAGPLGLPATSTVEVVGGHDHFCARHLSGTVYCWGRTHMGQGGTVVDTVNLAEKTLAEATAIAHPFPAPVVSLSAGAYLTCAIAGGDRGVYCIGSNARVRIDPREESDWATNAPAPLAGLSGVVALAADGSVCALVEGGFVRCRGASDGGPGSSWRYTEAPWVGALEGL